MIPLVFYYVNGVPFIQLLRARDNGGRFSSFVMIRVVRLTIETNALTGIFPLSNPTPTTI